MRMSSSFNTHNAMLSLLLRFAPNSALTANTMHVGLFSNNMPIDDQILDLITTTNNSVAWNGTVLVPFAPQGNMLADVAVQAITPVYDPDSNTLNIPLSAQQNMFNVSTAGTPKWFLLRYLAQANSTDNYAGFSANGTAYVILWGTVGDENSNADMKIVGGTVAAGTPVRVSDIRIKF